MKYQCKSDIKQKIMGEDRENLFHIINNLSVRTGIFKMASGATSNIMIDMSKSLRTEKAQYHLSNLVKEVLPNNIIVGGPISGSDLVCSAIARAGLCKEWFGVRANPKGRGLDVDKITGNLEKGDKVWVVEDVCTSGGTIQRAIDVILEFGAKIEGVFAVVNRGGLDIVAKKNNVKKVSIFSLKEFEIKNKLV